MNIADLRSVEESGGGPVGFLHLDLFVPNHLVSTDHVSFNCRVGLCYVTSSTEHHIQPNITL